MTFRAFLLNSELGLSLRSVTLHSVSCSKTLLTVELVTSRTDSVFFSYGNSVAGDVIDRVVFGLIQSFRRATWDPMFEEFLKNFCRIFILFYLSMTPRFEASHVQKYF